MRTKILLVTTVNWPSAARLAGAFANLGAMVEAVFPRGHVLRLCRYLSKAYRYRPLDGAASLSEAIVAAKPDRVIPCDDRALSLLLSLSEFSPLLETSLGPRGAYEVLTARAPSIAAAREIGVCAPLTLAVESRATLRDALYEVGLPCVMKADGSWGGGGVKFVSSFGEATRAYDELEGPPNRLRSLARAMMRGDAHFLLEARNPLPSRVNVQALVPGKPATSVFAAREGQVLAALHMDVLSWSGDTGPASLMARVDDPVMQIACEKIAKRFALNGLIGLDFMRDAQGAPHLIEVNPRATQICHLALNADLPAALLGALARDPVTTGRQIALFPQLLSAGILPHTIYQDIPYDDPAVLAEVAGALLPEAEALCEIGEFLRPDYAPPIHRKSA
ncbi:hypothetical protein FHS83_001796 [Rhizomicrobium palustre]|uniref:ATP-grasp domain-containing protein n=1 Tax=Rhizomicrobium palustre TaxID=189966 RepID=A0A846MY02_9PROT|nr:ATP-grasp domain-containing protein [Rhizomicrobium palustre]NIK88478.1 hypothetical protein [Rhizomicrobium palustre]